MCLGFAIKWNGYQVLLTGIDPEGGSCKPFKIMKTKILFASALLMFAFACDDGDNVIPEKTSLLKLTVDASWAGLGADNWIIVHGEDGSLLASESFAADQELEIVTDKPAPGKITVTHLRHVISNGNKHYIATSHLNIEKGKHMILKVSDGTPSQLTGELNVSVTDVGYRDHHSVSCRVGSAGSASWSSGDYILHLRSSTFAGASKHIVTVSDGFSLKHKVLNNVQPNDSYSFSLNDMDLFDKTVDFTFPQSNQVTLYVQGSEPDATLIPNRYTLTSHFNSDPHTTIKAGYLNSLTNYNTYLYIVYPEYQYEYENLAAIPDGNIAWPQKSDFNISEKSFTNFSATTSKSYVWRKSRWGYSDVASKTVVTWDVLSSSGNQSILELPSEITSVHPILSLNNIKHASTTFYTQSPAFESIVNADFENGPEPNGLRLGIRIITN